MKSDIQIAQEAKMEPIIKIAQKLNLTEDDIELYGKYKCKIGLDVLNNNKSKEGKLVLVTAINPTPAGEGKSTVTVGLGQALCKKGKNAVIALREPSLGPVFGRKGGEAGGGYSQVVPMEDINLHFTGDMHAITATNNLLCAAIDNHIHQGNLLRIDSRRIVFKRVMDMNDRALRNVIVGMGGKVNGFVREDGFMITVASEIMAILCLASDLSDLKKRMGEIVVAYDLDGNPVYAKQLEVEGAMALLMKDAIKPNLVQTLENTPAIIHGGPFANIAHGCNSVIATKLALKLGDIVITEAGFGADLGAEKFLDIKCRYGGLNPNCVVVVATIRALKHHGGVSKEDLNTSNVEALSKGIVNLEKQIENINKYNVPVVVAINRFLTDSDDEVKFIKDYCNNIGVKVALSDVWAKGGEGGLELADIVEDVLENEKSDMNDRALRNVIVGMGGKVNGFVREDGFMITVASEIMAILCLASDLNDLKERMGEIVVAYDLDGNPVYAKQLEVEGAMALLMKDAIKPNLVQTLENTPAIIHGGPFANIAHGCNSVIATKLALKLGDIVVTEAGFGADLGAEKFLDIKCRYGGLNPNCVVVVATIRALKHHGGVSKEELNTPNVEALSKGIVNLEKQIENIKKYNVPVVVAINKFLTDSNDEVKFVKDYCNNIGVKVALSDVWAKGGEGGLELADIVEDVLENEKSDFKPIYDVEKSIEEKVLTIAKEIYGADGVQYSAAAKRQIKELEKFALDKLPICMAKTQYSLSDNPSLLGRPSGFDITVKEVKVSNGAGFIVVLTGDVMTMPGLPKVPAANKMDILENGEIVGLF